MSRIRQIAERPDLFDRFLAEDKDFKHIFVIVIPVADDPNDPTKIRQYAYVRPQARVVGVRQGTLEASLVLPAWMTDESAARKARKAVKQVDAVA